MTDETMVQKSSWHNGSTPPTLYTYTLSSTSTEISGAVIEYGRCASVVGYNVLDKQFFSMKLTGIPDASPACKENLFGDHLQAHTSKCAVPIPFHCTDENNNNIWQFNVQFEVIAGNLPFPIGLPSFLAMR